MKMLGLNPTEQEVVDIPNNIAKYADNITVTLLRLTGRVFSGKVSSTSLTSVS